MTKDQVVGTIRKTNEYWKFEKLLGNRDVSESRKAAIVNSIRERGYLISPILVNEKFEIIDGQGRFEACKELNLPIVYTIQQGLSIDDCIAMNIKMKNWNMTDFIESYSNRGNPDYMILKRLICEYPSIGAATIAGMASGLSGSGGTIQEKIKKGQFQLKVDVQSLKNTLSFVAKIQSLTGDVTGQRKDTAVAFCYGVNGVDILRLEKTICDNHRAIAIPSAVSDIIAEIERAYNYRLKLDNHIFFSREYERVCRDKNAAYASRWLARRAENN